MRTSLIVLAFIATLIVPALSQADDFVVPPNAKYCTFMYTATSTSSTYTIVANGQCDGQPLPQTPTVNANINEIAPTFYQTFIAQEALLFLEAGLTPVPCGFTACFYRAPAPAAVVREPLR